MSNVRRSWSIIGKRTVFPNQQEFSNRYLYTAIDPIEGSSHHLMGFDATSTQQTELFIQSLQEKYPDDHLIIIWDRASFHRSKRLYTDHVTPIMLPAYSPQLNPVERFFGEVRKFTANRVFYGGMDALFRVLERALMQLSDNLDTMKTLTGYDWIKKQWDSVSSLVTTRSGG
jgi:hypothetical protein